jgi:hypothetical protein
MKTKLQKKTKKVTRKNNKQNGGGGLKGPDTRKVYLPGLGNETNDNNASASASASASARNANYNEQDEELYSEPDLFNPLFTPKLTGYSQLLSKIQADYQLKINRRYNIDNNLDYINKLFTNKTENDNYNNMYTNIKNIKKHLFEFLKKELNKLKASDIEKLSIRNKIVQILQKKKNNNNTLKNSDINNLNNIMTSFSEGSTFLTDQFTFRNDKYSEPRKNTIQKKTISDDLARKRKLILLLINGWTKILSSQKVLFDQIIHIQDMMSKNIDIHISNSLGNLDKVFDDISKIIKDSSDYIQTIYDKSKRFSIIKFFNYDKFKYMSEIKKKINNIYLEAKKINTILLPYLEASTESSTDPGSGQYAAAANGRTGQYAAAANGRTGQYAAAANGRTGQYAEATNGRPGQYAEATNGRPGQYAELPAGKGHYEAVSPGSTSNSGGKDKYFDSGSYEGEYVDPTSLTSVTPDNHYLKVVSGSNPRYMTALPSSMHNIYMNLRPRNTQGVYMDSENLTSVPRSNRNLQQPQQYQYFEVADQVSTDPKYQAPPDAEPAYAEVEPAIQGNQGNPREVRDGKRDKYGVAHFGGYKRKTQIQKRKTRKTKIHTRKVKQTRK